MCLSTSGPRNNQLHVPHQGGVGGGGGTLEKYSTKYVTFTIIACEVRKHLCGEVVGVGMGGGCSIHSFLPFLGQ